MASGGIDFNYFIWFTNKKVHRISTKQHGMKSGVAQSKNSAIS